MKGARFQFVSLLGLTLLVCLSGTSAAAARRNPYLGSMARPFDRLVSTDLNGDLRLDTATLGSGHREDSGFVQDVTVRLGSGNSRTISVHTARGTARLSWRDLDGDTDADLVLEACDREPLAVLLNDGAGNFRAGIVGEYRDRLKHRDPRGWDVPAGSSDSTEMAEATGNAPAVSGPSGFQHELASHRLSFVVTSCRLAAGHTSSSSRGPPLSC